MKRKVSVYVCGVLLAMVLGVHPVFAYLLQFESVTDVANQSITVNIYAGLDQGEELEAMDFSVLYDPSVLQYTGSDISTELMALDFLGFSNDTGSSVAFSLFGLDMLAGPASYQLGYIQFAVLDTADSSSTMVTFDDVGLYNGDVDPVDLSDIFIDAGSGDVTLPPSTTMPVPLPPTLLLTGSGLIFMAAAHGRKFLKR